MTETLQPLLAAKTVIVLIWLAALFVGERVRPAVDPPAGAGRWGWRRVARNGGLWLINVGLSPLVVLPITAWAASLQIGVRPGWWSGGPGLALDLLLLDVWIYWWHRANHALPLLWRFHQVHHLDGFLDTTSAVRFHFGEVLLSALVRAGVIVAFAIPLGSVVVFELLVLLAALFHHSNLRLPAGLERRLSRIVVTPSIHWVHHHAVRRDTDSNYATVLSAWDRLFGSASPTPRTASLRIGVENQADPGFAGLIRLPFRSGN